MSYTYAITNVNNNVSLQQNSKLLTISLVISTNILYMFYLDT